MSPAEQRFLDAAAALGDPRAPGECFEEVLHEKRFRCAEELVMLRLGLASLLRRELVQPGQAKGV